MTKTNQKRDCAKLNSLEPWLLSKILSRIAGVWRWPWKSRTVIITSTRNLRSLRDEVREWMTTSRARRGYQGSCGRISIATTAAVSWWGRDTLELISLGAHLPGILNRLCTAIDVQIGNVVSLVVLPNGEQNQLGPLTRSAMQVGLSVFSSTAILSRDKSLLGTFQLYCCDQRRPTLTCPPFLVQS